VGIQGGVELLRDRPVSRSAIKAALHVLVRTTAWGRNRIKAVDITGTVPVPVDMLFDDGVERRACELVLAALDMLFDDATERRACELVLTAAAHGAVPERVTTAMLGILQFWCLNRGYWKKKCAATVYSYHCGTATSAVGTCVAGFGPLVCDYKRLGT
jgi:hypothetical protein